MKKFLSEDTMMWISIASGIGLLISAIAIPWIVVKMPQDTFTNVKRQEWLDRQPPAVRVPLRILKNLFGLLLVILGIAMLVLPGQGILSILLGVMLADFPGKQKVELWLLSKPKVIESLNWLRRKFQRPPLQKPSSSLAA
jgi:putative transmembrane protein PGPGW